MGKGKKIWNKPVLDNRRGLAKLKPIEQPKKAKKKLGSVKYKKNTVDPGWNKVALNNLMSVLQKNEPGYYQLAQSPQVFNYFNPSVSNTFIQEYANDFKPEKTKQPTVGDWAEEWYEKNR